MDSQLYTQLLIDEINGDGAIKVGPYRYYLLKREGSIILLPRIDSKYMSHLNTIRELIKKYPTMEDIKILSSNYSFENLYKLLIERINDELNEITGVTFEEDREQLAKLIFWELTGLARIAPFLYPTFIEEIYCDGPNTQIYIRHEDLGIIDTDILITKPELNALINHIEMHKGTNIDLLKGNIESEIRTRDFHSRIIIDLNPLTYKGPYIIIRNLKSKKLSIIDLIKNQTITRDAAAFLILALWFRRNITIAGEVYSGKTTLLNALDHCIPPNYRRVYIEDALESKDMRRTGYKQAFYRAESYSKLMDKRRQLIFTLHRSPDTLILGEILTNDDIETFFYALACGLRGLQTIHAQNIESLINRWIYQAKINTKLLSEIDLIVVMKRDITGKRYVEGIYEVNVNGDEVNYIPIFKRIGGELKKIVDLDQTDLINKISQEIDLDTINKLYSAIITTLSNENISTIETELKHIYNWLRGGAMINEYTNPI